MGKGNTVDKGRKRYWRNGGAAHEKRTYYYSSVCGAHRITAGDSGLTGTKTISVQCFDGREALGEKHPALSFDALAANGDIESNWIRRWLVLCCWARSRGVLVKQPTVQCVRDNVS